MSEVGQNESEHLTPEIFEGAKYNTMIDAMNRIDKGEGSPEDVTAAITNGADFYTARAKNIPQGYPEKDWLSRDAEKFTRAREGGHYGEMWFCSDVSRWYYEKAMDAAKKYNPQEKAESFVKKAQNWQNMLRIVSEAKPAQPVPQSKP